MEDDLVGELKAVAEGLRHMNDAMLVMLNSLDRAIRELEARKAHPAGSVLRTVGDVLPIMRPDHLRSALLSSPPTSFTEACEGDGPA